MNCYVTGGTGFIGRHLISKLRQAGHEVTAGYRTDPGDEPGVTWEHTGDLVDSTPDFAGIDVVFHLAGRAHRVGADGDEEAAESLRVNVGATQAVVRAAVAAAVSRVVFVSSVAVYGSHPASAVDEATPTAPDTAYGRTKLEAEAVIEKGLAGTPVDWVVMRPALVYGAGNPGNMSRLLALVRRGLPLPFGSIDNRRSFVHVDDLIDALVAVSSHPAARGQAFVVSDGHPVSTPDLIREIAGVAGQSARMLSVPVGVLKVLGKVGDIGSRLLRRPLPFDGYSIERLTSDFVVTPARLEEAVSWSPAVPLREGLRRTLEARGSGSRPAGD